MRSNDILRPAPPLYVTGYLFLSPSGRSNVYSQQRVKQSHWTRRWSGDHYEKRGSKRTGGGHHMLNADSEPLPPMGSGFQNTSSQTFTHLVRSRVFSGVPDQSQEGRRTDTNTESLPTNSPHRSLYNETERRRDSPTCSVSKQLFGPLPL